MVSGKRNKPRQASQTFTESIQEAMDRGLMHKDYSLI